MGPRQRSHLAKAAARASAGRRARAETSGPPAPGVAQAFAATAQSAARAAGSESRAPGAPTRPAFRNACRYSSEGGSKYARSAQSRRRLGTRATAGCPETTPCKACAKRVHKAAFWRESWPANMSDACLASATASTAAGEGAPTSTSAAAFSSAGDCAAGPYLASSGCSKATRKAARRGPIAVGSEQAAAKSAWVSWQLAAADASSDRWRTSSVLRPAMATASSSSSPSATKPVSAKATEGWARPSMASNTARWSSTRSVGIGMAAMHP
mmetsp:Transcript_106834/g.297415  ORF Transcript_106834/g.297415 Transcript_106834/m.297415 type:complete len:269 (+) Transcript_106834:627-1433(+)